MAARLPIKLENEIMEVGEHFLKAVRCLTAKDIMRTIPLVYPSTDAINAINRHGISQWGLKSGKRDGSLFLDKSGWCALTMIIAQKDIANLGDLCRMAKPMKAQPLTRGVGTRRRARPPHGASQRALKAVAGNKGWSLSNHLQLFNLVDFRGSA